MLVNGKWQGDWSPNDDKDTDGEFVRQTSSFRNWITPDGSAGPTGSDGFKAEPGRYHLYVAYICPWASRALMVRALKNLDSLISVSVLNPQLTDQGWAFEGFPGATRDDIYGLTYMHELYTKADPEFTGRATVPVLWDKQRETIVNNESADILRMLNKAFEGLGTAGPDLYPQDLASDIDALNKRLYENLNNGVYQAGFATRQAVYEEAYTKVFATLDDLEARLADGRPFLLGERLTETDVRLFVTLIRFDAAYHGLFKCNRNTLRAMPHLMAYTQRIFALPGVRETVHVDHIKAGYYSIKELNPRGLIPLGPEDY
ncbi:glutathione S-transferase family protein [Teredinibacter turnerae]|uniref:glutathione S-transferase family protein n=1 Tax=Teredinibacter turnerae TaxID=2426 RepID=UPI0003674CFB|nr:glutathione S-transferase family protein [Teredinibacter turnerae]